jgi:hypothetical protein
MITSNLSLGSFSYRRTSKFCVDELSANNTERHSMLNMRFGALPVTEVKTPHVPPGKLAQPLKPMSVRISSQAGKMVKSYGPMLGGAGRQFVTKPPGSFATTKSRRPFELTFTLLNVWLYNVNGKGNVTGVSTSSP